MIEGEREDVIEGGIGRRREGTYKILISCNILDI